MNRYCLLCLLLLLLLGACVSPPLSSSQSDPTSEVDSPATPVPAEAIDWDPDAPFPVRKIREYELPEGLSFGASFDHALSWQDSLGTNYLIFSSELTTNEDVSQNFSLYADHYAGADSAYELISHTQDFNLNCEFDNMLDWVREATQVTDLDRDGTAEFTFLYTLGCVSDVSPYPLKLIMREGPQKMAIRGSVRLKYLMDTETSLANQPQDKNIDEASFAGKPASFREFASGLWDAYEIR